MGSGPDSLFRRESDHARLLLKGTSQSINVGGLDGGRGQWSGHPILRHFLYAYVTMYVSPFNTICTSIGKKVLRMRQVCCVSG